MNIQKMMKQAAKMQEQLTASLAEKTAEVSVGGGKVTVVANGLGDLVSIRIAKEVVDPEDVEMLEDLLTAAFNEAGRRAEELLKSSMQGMLGGLNLPEGLL